MLKTGAKAKPGTATQQRFAPFTKSQGAFQDEIINTSKEVGGEESQKTINEAQSHGSNVNNGETHADPNFRPQSK